MRATKITLITALLVLTLTTVAVSADTGCPAVDSSTDVAPRVVEITVYRVTGKTVELIGVVEDPDSGLREWIWTSATAPWSGKQVDGPRWAMPHIRW